MSEDDENEDGSTLDASEGVHSELEKKAALIKDIKELTLENKTLHGRLIVTDPALVANLRKDNIEKQERVKELTADLIAAIGTYDAPPDFASIKQKYQLFVDETKKFAQDNKIDSNLWKDLKY